MQQVKDNEGRPWTIMISCAAVGRVLDLVKIEREVEVARPDGSTSKAKEVVPFQIGEAALFGEVLGILRQRFLVLGETLYAVVKPQCDEKNISRDAFLEGLAGDALEAMHKALIDEIIEFLPTKVRGMARVLRAKFDEMGEALLETAEQQLAGLDSAAAAKALMPADTVNKVAAAGGDA